MPKIDVSQGPSGECFKNAKEWAWNNDDGNTFVVHGLVTNIERKTFVHAWVEQGETVIDPTQGISMNKSRYYELVNASPEVKYTPEQILVNSLRNNHWGPWTPEEREDRFVSNPREDT